MDEGLEGIDVNEPREGNSGKGVLEKTDSLILVWNSKRAKDLAGYMSAECGARLDKSRGVYHVDRLPEAAPGIPGVRDYWGISGAHVKLQYALKNGEVKAPLYILVLGDPQNRESALTYLTEVAGGVLE